MNEMVAAGSKPLLSVANNFQLDTNVARHATFGVAEAGGILIRYLSGDKACWLNAAICQKTIDGGESSKSNQKSHWSTRSTQRFATAWNKATIYRTSNALFFISTILPKLSFVPVESPNGSAQSRFMAGVFRSF